MTQPWIASIVHLKTQPAPHPPRPIPTCSRSECLRAQVIDSILFRLASTKDDEVPARIQRVLPRLLTLLPTARPKVTAKIVEVLSHINKRLRVVGAVKLPLAELLSLFGQHASHTVTASFILIYVEKAFASFSLGDRAHLMPLLLCELPRLAPAVQTSVLHLLLSCGSPPPAGSAAAAAATGAALGGGLSAGLGGDRSRWESERLLDWSRFEAARAAAASAQTQAPPPPRDATLDQAVAGVTKTALGQVLAELPPFKLRRARVALARNERATEVSHASRH